MKTIDPKKIHVRYFAQLKDERGLAEETVSTRARTVKELYDELHARHSLSMSKASLRVAVNDEFGDWNALLCDRDAVAFLPPVAGG